MNRKPNIVWLMSDQHNADATGIASGGVVDTPHLDRLSERGMRFDAAFCQGPLCMPSRASLLYQRYVTEHGVVDNKPERPVTESTTLAQRLQAAGYRTTALGKMHFYKYPRDVRDTRARMHELGFDEALEMHGKYGNAGGRSEYTDHLETTGQLEAYTRFLTGINPMSRDRPGVERTPHWRAAPAPLRDEDHPDVWLGDRVVEWLRDQDGAEPFFLWVGFSGPHDPWDAPASYVERYAHRSIPAPVVRERPDTHGSSLGDLVDHVADYCDADSMPADAALEVRRHYYAGVTLLDDQIGRVLVALDEAGLAESTIVVYCSDHGELLGEHGLFTKFLFYDEATRVPLTISVPGAPPGSYQELVELTDLTATLLDLAGTPIQPGEPGRSLRDLLGGGRIAPRPYVRSESDGFGMWRTDRHKLVIRIADTTPVQLFDLAADPHERRDLLDDPAYATVRQELLDLARADLATA